MGCRPKSSRTLIEGMPGNVDGDYPGDTTHNSRLLGCIRITREAPPKDRRTYEVPKGFMGKLRGPRN
eukprot:16433583-Heterocapsa_arctica.AAC.2